MTKGEYMLIQYYITNRLVSKDDKKRAHDIIQMHATKLYQYLAEKPQARAARFHP